MKFRLIMSAQLIAALLAVNLCNAHKVKVRNHTDQAIAVTIHVVGIPKPPKIIKPGKRREFETGALLWTKIIVKTLDGKRHGSAGPDCDFRPGTPVFVRKKGGRELEYHTDCTEYYIGYNGDAIFDVFLPSQGKYKMIEKGIAGYKTETIRDIGDNLVIVLRDPHIKY